MKPIRFFLALLCLITLASTFSACQLIPNLQAKAPKTLLEKVKQRGKLIVGVKYESKPFGYMDTDGEVKGFDVELAKHIAKGILGKSDAIEFQQVLTSTRVLELQHGNVDMVVATMTITPKRKRQVLFSEPYYIAGQAVLVAKNSKVETVEDLNHPNIKVFYILGSTSEETIHKRIPRAELIGFKTSTDAFAALKAGRGEAMTTDDTILAGFLTDSCAFRMLPDRLSQEPYGVAVKKSSLAMETDSFIEKVNLILKDVENTGLLEDMNHRWMERFIHGTNCP